MAAGPGDWAIAATPAKSVIEAPIIPGRPARAPAKTPGARPAVPDVSDPGRVIVARAIDYHVILDFCSPIAGGIAFIDEIGHCTVNLYISQVVQRRIGWDVRILGLSEIVVVVDCLVACSLQIWGVMEAIGEI